MLCLQGFQNLMLATGSMTPDIVSFNGLLWDLGRLQVHNKMLHSQQFLSKDFVHTYKLYLDNWLGVIEVSLLTPFHIYTDHQYSLSLN